MSSQYQRIKDLVKELGWDGKHGLLAKTFLSQSPRKLCPRQAPTVTVVPAGEPRDYIVYLDVTLQAEEGDLKAYKASDSDDSWVQFLTCRFLINGRETEKRTTKELIVMLENGFALAMRDVRCVSLGERT